MKKLITILFLIPVSCLFAQPVITNPTLAALIGSNYALSNADSMASPGPAGANVTWDFSALLVYAGTSYTVNVLTTDGDTTALRYPASNIELQGPNNKTFESLTDASVTVFGSFNSVQYTILSTGDEQVQYPLTYNTSWTSNYAGNEFVPPVNTGFPFTGTRTVIADGWGTLKTPYGTATGVIRLLSYGHATYNFSGFVQDVKDTAYLWMLQGQLTPLLSITHSAISGSAGTILTKSTLVLQSTTAGINEVSKLLYVEVFPNPATDFIKIGNEIRTGGAYSVCIYDVIGRLVKQTFIKDNNQLDIVDLVQGYYTGIISDDKKALYRFRFVKQ